MTLWDQWYQFLSAAENDQDLHKYRYELQQKHFYLHLLRINYINSAEKHRIIVCGNAI